METNILTFIFFDENKNGDPFVKKYDKRIRSLVLKEVEKFRSCGDPRNGFKLLVCEGCHHVRRVPFRCKGRFCTTCSCGETEEIPLDVVRSFDAMDDGDPTVATAIRLRVVQKSNVP
ncbi:transposase zinc-binding domain-containing protein [Brevibacillus sp. NRS-1366]